MSRQRPLKVLMVTGAYYPEISSGGLQVRMMAEAMRGVATVRVLTTALDLTTPGHSTIDDVEVTRIHLRAVTTGAKAMASGRFVSELTRLVAWCDVVHLHGVSSKNIALTIAARLMGKPIVLSLHTMGADEPQPVKRSGPLSWWAFRSAARYLGVSAGICQSYFNAGLPADRIELLGNGIDTTKFSPASAGEKQRLRQSLGLDPERPVVLFVGFFSHDKQPRVLFDAWLRLRDQHSIDANLVCVGATRSDYFEVDASLADRMRADAESRGLGDRLTFAGTVHDVQSFFRLADVFVLASRREGMPVALLEAMSCALPCVASNLPGATDTLIADGVSGLLVPPGDVEIFAQAICAVLTDRQRAARIGAAAREVVIERFSVATIAARWLANYQIALGSQASIGPENSGPPAAG